MFTRRFNKQGVTLSRAVGWLLVVFILYGTTVEAAHRHGRVLPSVNNAASLFKTGTTDSPLGNKTSCNECLICQLHQNFTSTLISVRPNAVALAIHTTSCGLDPISVHSRVNIPRSGGAPPQAN